MAEKNDMYELISKIEDALAHLYNALAQEIAVGWTAEKLGTEILAEMREERCEQLETELAILDNQQFERGEAVVVTKRPLAS